MEVIFQTCVNFGMPPMLEALEIFVQIMAEDGRLAEIGQSGAARGRRSPSDARGG